MYAATKTSWKFDSEGLHAELAKDQGWGTTVVPGQVRTGSHSNAVFKRGS